MKAYILRRMLWVPVVLLVVSFVTFALGTYGPGDPVSVLADSTETGSHCSHKRATRAG